ncbi:hypothetical protein FRUB_06303 [Fimbriiglobus ruber]|uniref:Uncharacterized protein n=1 Tax=Fimbriiglobus ruber TaxID=1908690 RepID=A0A225DCE6_9BACT|nr:hypothetical protein FRUB_06303 [Fimbriiglobus ruber]
MPSNQKFEDGGIGVGRPPCKEIRVGRCPIGDDVAGSRACESKFEHVRSLRLIEHFFRTGRPEGKPRMATKGHKEAQKE